MNVKCTPPRILDLCTISARSGRLLPVESREKNTGHTACSHSLYSLSYFCIHGCILEVILWAQIHTNPLPLILYLVGQYIVRPTNLTNHSADKLVTYLIIFECRLLGWDTLLPVNGLSTFRRTWLHIPEDGSLHGHAVRTSDLKMSVIQLVRQLPIYLASWYS